MFEPLPLAFFLFCGAVSLLLWYQMLRVLKSKGRDFSSWWITLGQYLAFVQVIKEEKDPQRKRQYRLLFAAQMGIILLYLVGMPFLIE